MMSPVIKRTVVSGVVRHHLFSEWSFRIIFTGKFLPTEKLTHPTDKFGGPNSTRGHTCGVKDLLDRREQIFPNHLFTFNCIEHTEITNRNAIHLRMDAIFSTIA
uniref:Uncharacterized protein n=1 Tax=Yersinia enterocolitica TaxID=630 RepID=B0RL07_YEREN|nr:hypothetical protein [Yersinia enterocolitica]